MALSIRRVKKKFCLVPHMYRHSAMHQMHKGEYAKITLFYTRQQRTLSKIFATLEPNSFVCGGDVALQVIGIIIRIRL